MHMHAGISVAVVDCRMVWDGVASAAVVASRQRGWWAHGAGAYICMY